jgi:hypothetical protein
MNKDYATNIITQYKDGEFVASVHYVTLPEETAASTLPIAFDRLALVKGDTVTVQRVDPEDRTKLLPNLEVFRVVSSGRGKSKIMTAEPMIGKSAQRTLRRIDAVKHGNEWRAARAENLKIIAANQCPKCGSGIAPNNSIRGWYQCEQYGSIGFRKDSTKPACNWQVFTE